jgi:uncharacterized protein (TIGR02145 family)
LILIYYFIVLIHNWSDDNNTKRSIAKPKVCRITLKYIGMKNKFGEITCILLLVFFSSCKKEDIKVPTIRINEIRDLDTAGAIIECIVTDDGGAPIIASGLCWSITEDPTVANDKTAENSEKFTVNLKNLEPGLIYKVRAYATNSAGTGYGNVSTIETPGGQPVFNDYNWQGIYDDSTIVRFFVNPKRLITIAKVEYGETTDYGSSVTKLVGFPGYNPDDLFYDVVVRLNGLKNAKTYHYRIVATNQKGAATSPDRTFVTPGSLPTFDDYFNYSDQSGGVKITSTIYSTLKPTIEIEWGTTTTYGNITTASFTKNGTYQYGITADLTGLLPSTEYHVRTKVTNNVGTVYGTDHVIRTDDWVPWIESQINNIQLRSATLAGRVLTWGVPSTVSFEWGPTADYGNTVPLTIGSPGYSEWVNVSADIYGLSPNKIYYYGLKVTNEFGTTIERASFGTPGNSPFTTITEAVTGVNEVNIEGSVNPNFLTTTVIIEWGTGGYDNSIILPGVYDGAGAINVSGTVSGLDPETNYRFRIKAENELGSGISSEKFVKTYSAKDADNNLYRSILIGTQRWLTENLKTTKYSNGDLIGTTDPQTKDIIAETAPKYQWPAGQAEINVPVYGRLYSWYAVTDSRKICPAGWHVPTDVEMTTLATTAGGSAEAGGKLKETGTAHWSAPNDGAVDTYGFTAPGSGGRLSSGTFNNLKNHVRFWTITPFDATQSLIWSLDYISPFFTKDKMDTRYGASVRCLKD